ncbi:MAG TPA: HAMP domain-containing sensor histidine kinase [Acetobacteraceae bacterium]|nr:HAMP domain-containing sensor histidine kinase [Acetobacteraceae bacterium]
MPDESAPNGQLDRELNYYRRECNDLGARLLRLQEEQSLAFREARRSRTVAKLIREAYRLVDAAVDPHEIAGPMLEIVVDNAMCDRAALMREEPPDSGRFHLVHAIGLPADPAANPTLVPGPPAFFFTTAQTRIEPPAYELTGILQLPYICWAYDRPSGQALIIGNRLESNVSRPFEAGDQELVDGALSVYLDVLIRKQAEHALRTAKQAAEDAGNARATFLATLSHELRSPLNSIIGFSEIMSSRSGYRLSGRQYGDYADQILESGNQLLALINDILEYSAIAKGLPALDLKWAPLAEILGTAIRAAAPMGAKGGVTLSVTPIAPALEILVDLRRFRQILSNLLSNAIKFTPSGGAVTICAASPPEGGLEVSVQDTGVGMRPEDIPTALEPFRQVENVYTRSVQGTGLGLPITRGLVEAHGGRLRIHSTPGGGTQAVVVLPEECVRQQTRGDSTGMPPAS